MWLVIKNEVGRLCTVKSFTRARERYHGPVFPRLTEICRVSLFVQDILLFISWTTFTCILWYRCLCVLQSVVFWQRTLRFKLVQRFQNALPFIWAFQVKAMPSTPTLRNFTTWPTQDRVTSKAELSWWIGLCLDYETETHPYQMSCSWRMLQGSKKTQELVGNWQRTTSVASRTQCLPSGLSSTPSTTYTKNSSPSGARSRARIKCFPVLHIPRNNRPWTCCNKMASSFVWNQAICWSAELVKGRGCCKPAVKCLFWCKKLGITPCFVASMYEDCCLCLRLQSS